MALRAINPRTQTNSYALNACHHEIRSGTIRRRPFANVFGGLKNEGRAFMSSQIQWLTKKFNREEKVSYFDKIRSEVPVVEKSVHDYLIGIIRATHPHRDIEIIGISEQREAHEGWDYAINDGVVPFFLQYKLPNFTGRSHYDWSIQHEARANYGFDDDEGVFHFPLRKKSQNALISQHQLLLNLEKSGENVFYASTIYKDFKNLWRAGAGFGGGQNSTWRVWHTLSILQGTRLERQFAPHVSGLIFIPPFSEVTDPPESHRFFYNSFYEVSLHSDPTNVPSMSLDELTGELAKQLNSEKRIQAQQMNESYVSRLFKSLVGNAQESSQISQSLSSSYDFSLRFQQRQQRSAAYNRWAALRQVLWQEAGIDLFLAADKPTR